MIRPLARSSALSRPRGAEYPSRSISRRLMSAALSLAVAVPASVGVVTATASTSAAASCPSPGTGSVAEASVPVTSEVVFRGHGWGHGLGMSQYGAQGAARLGCSYRQILSTYYAKTKVVEQSVSAPVRLSMLAGSSRSTVLAETGGVLWRAGVVQAEGTTWQVVRRSEGGIALVDDAGTQRAWVPDGATLSLRHTGTVIRVRSFTGTRTSASKDLRTRWDVASFTASASGTTVRQAIVGDSTGTAAQKYLWGLAEVPSSWPLEALKAQVIAARTYLASKYVASQKAYVLATTTADQVYSGYAHELADTGGRWRSAVDATRGQVVVDAKGVRITTMYSSSAGGYTEDRAYVYGSYGISYLKAVDDSRWDLASDNKTRRSWAVGLSRAQVARKLGFTSISNITIAAQGSAKRWQGLKVTGVRAGTTVTVAFTGSAARSKLALPSPGFTVLMQAAPVTPTEPATPASGRPLSGDWDGDGVTDVGWYSAGVIHLRTRAGKTYAYRFGPAGAVAVVGDWDGDGSDSIATFKDGAWALRNELTAGPADSTFSYGRRGDIPVAGHWGGVTTGSAIGVVRGNTWKLRMSATPGGTVRSFVWGPKGSVFMMGDWDGDGVDGPAVRSRTRWTLGEESSTNPGYRPPARQRSTALLGTVAELPLLGAWDGGTVDHPGIARRDGAFRWKSSFTSGAWTGGLDFTG